jgi:hypothetical protein
MKMIESFSALSSGCQVWVVPQLEQSSWARKIDGHLNFQLLRSEPHTPRELPEPLKQICDWTEFEAPPFTFQSNAPLMVASQSLLPNGSTILVPVSEDGLVAWSKKCHQIWTGLGRPSMRVFMPDQTDVSTFKEAWPEVDRSAPVEIVPSVEP